MIVYNVTVLLIVFDGGNKIKCFFSSAKKKESKKDAWQLHKFNFRPGKSGMRMTLQQNWISVFIGIELGMRNARKPNTEQYVLHPS